MVDQLWKNATSPATSNVPLRHTVSRRAMPFFAHRLLNLLLPLLATLTLLPGPAEARSKSHAKPHSVSSPAQPTMLQNDEIVGFIRLMSERHGFEQSLLTAIFEHQHPDQRVIRIMAPAPTQLTPNWTAYRDRFVNQRRINRGVQFWETYAETLDKAAREYGVPAEIIVAIIGVETEYGRNMGSFNVLNALASLGFYGERRREFFQTELEQYLLLARDNAMDLDTTRGSFAGAMGIPQFMPSSQRRWGVDYDGNGRIDLTHSPIDAIGSVANFLKSHGWQTGEPAVIPVTAPQPLPEAFEKVEVKPGIPLAQYRAADFTYATPLAPSLRDSTLATLVSLSTPRAPTQYWLGLNNYYVVTRYNRSAAYAMSVIELGDAIRNARSTALQ